MLSNEPDPYSAQRYPLKFQVKLGHQAHNARQVMKHAKAIGRYQNMYRTPLKKDKIDEIQKKTGYVQHGDQLVKKSYAAKVRKEAARELRRREGKPVVGGTHTQMTQTRATAKLLALLAAPASQSPAIVLATTKRLLAAGADVNAKNARLENPLHLAIQGNMWDVAVAVLEYGADPDLMSDEFENDGITPAIAVIMRTHDVPRWFISALIEHGADVVAAATSNGMTTLEWAIARGDADLVTMLLDAGADPNVDVHSAAIAQHTHLTRAQLQAFDAMLLNAYGMRNMHWEFVGPGGPRY